MKQKISKINILIKKKYKYELLENGFNSKDISVGKKVLNSKRITMAQNTRSFENAFAKKLGATDASVTVGNSISETVNFRNKKLDESNRSDNLGVDITTYIGKKKSSISSSNLLKENLNILHMNIHLEYSKYSKIKFDI